MRVIFSLRTKKGEKYDKADRIHQTSVVVHDNSWIVYCIALCLYILGFVTLKTFMPDTNMASSKLWLVIILGLCFSELVRQFVMSFFNYKSTYRKINRVLHYPITVKKISEIKNYEGGESTKLVIEYSIDDTKRTSNFKMGLFFCSEDKIYFLSYLKSDLANSNVKMIVSEDELENIRGKLEVETGEVNIFIARIRKKSNLTPNSFLNDKKDIDDSIVIKDKLRAIVD